MEIRFHALNVGEFRKKREIKVQVKAVRIPGPSS